MKQEKIPLIKELYFDDFSGKIMIHDSNNNDYECNLYGEKISKFLPNITGCLDAVERNKKNLNTSIEFKNESKEFYHPQSSKFEGYFQYPNPLSVPFFNEKISEEAKKNLLKYVEKSKIFMAKKNQNFLTLKSNSGLHYLTSSFKYINENIKYSLIKMIDEYIAQKIEENKYVKDIVIQDSKIKALKKLKSLLIMNSGDKKIFNREGYKPDKKHFEVFKNVENQLKDYPKENEYNLNKYIKFLNKEFIKKKPFTPASSNFFGIQNTHNSNNVYNKTMTSNNYYYNTQYFNPITTEREKMQKLITRPNTLGGNGKGVITAVTENNFNFNINDNKDKDKDKENNLYNNTKTSFFSYAISNNNNNINNLKSESNVEKNNMDNCDDLSYGKFILFSYFIFLFLFFILFF
jgi:hypothetical protein